MGYIVDGLVLASCVGMYRVYTDRRKSRINTSLDSYQLLWLNLSRHAGDFIASMSSEVITKYPSQSRDFMTNFRSAFEVDDDVYERYRHRFLQRVARYRLWAGCKNLSYLQRVGRMTLPGPRNSIFGSSCESSWKRNLIFASPTFLSYVKDQPTKEYLHALSVVRDGFLGVLEGSSSELRKLLSLIDSRKRDVLQDVRKGHVLDRLPESSVPVLHELRMDVEAFLFSTTGPDPDRSSFIEKTLSESKSDPITRLSQLFPYLECIVDPVGDIPIRSDSPLPVFVPILYCNESPVGVAKDVGFGPQSFVLDPLLMGGQLLFDGRPEIPSDTAVGEKISLSLASSPSSDVVVEVVEILPQGVPVVKKV